MTSIDHHKTVSDYIEALELMDAVFVQYALQEHKLTGAPKKARKIVFPGGSEMDSTDPPS